MNGALQPLLNAYADGTPIDLRDQQLTGAFGTSTNFGLGALALTNEDAFRTYIGAGSSTFDGAYSSLSGIPSTFTPSAHTHTFASLTSKPTTVSGFGIIDAYTKTETDSAISSAVVGLLDDRGNFNASGNVFPSSGGSGTAGAILKGDLWTISVGGTLNSVAVTAGDVLRALTDTPGQTGSNWVVTENNLGYIPVNTTGTLVLSGFSSITGTVPFANLPTGTSGSTVAIGNHTHAGVYQPADSDLDVWAGITPTAGIGTFLAVPTLVNLKSAVTDETTAGWNLLTLTNPSAITFLRVNADNSVSTLDAPTFRTAIGAGTGDALVANPLSQFAATTSAQLRGVLSDENGTGVALFDNSTSATFITPILGTPTSGNLANCTFPTLNQNTTGSAAKWTTARNLAGNSVDGSANVAFANKFIAQGTVDAGLSAAQFLGALGTGIVKNTTTTGILSIAVSGDFPTLNQSTTGSAATLSSGRTIAITGDLTWTSPSFDGSGNVTAAGTLASVASAGTTGSSTAIPVITINAKGLTTIITTAAVVAPAGTLSGATLASGVTASSLTSFGNSPSFVTPVLGTPTSGTLTNCTFPTLNQNTSGSAASLSISGQTGLLTVTGLVSTNRVKTVRDAADTILELGGSYTPTGTWTSLTLVTPVLGTPASGNASNLTALNATQLTSGTVPLARLSGITTSQTSGIAASGANTDITSLSSAFPLTLPKITTGINDANGNFMLGFTATASAVNGVTFVNAATANPATVTIAAAGSDANITLALNAKGSGIVSITSACAISGHTTFEGVTSTGATGTGKLVYDGSPVLVTPALGTPASGTLTNCTFPTLNQNSTGSAASLSISGQTGLLTFTGLASTSRIKTVRDAADTLLELGGSYTPTGTWTSLTLVTPALGTPASGVVTNLTGTASININGTVGATTPAAGTFTTLVAGSTTSLLLGTAGSAVGNIGFRNATSGTTTLAPPTGALGTYTVTLPNAASTLPIFGQQITYAGPTAARTVTYPDASFTVARTDAANTFTGVQTMTSPSFAGTIAGTPAWASSQAITLSTAAQPSITSVGNTLTTGDGTSGAGVLTLNGGSASGNGPQIFFKRGGVNKWLVGTTSGILGGTSDDLSFYSYGLSGEVIHLNSSGGVVMAGVTDGSSAAAGKIGEYVSASVVQGSAVALTTATPKTVTSISLTAGDWDVTGIGAITGASTGTEFDVAISATTNSMTGTVLGDSRCQTPTVSLAGADATLMIPSFRVSISSTTTYYLVVQETFTLGSPAAYGRISARRSCH